MIWKIFKDKAVSDRIQDSAFYDAAVEEIDSGVRRPGLWAKALVEAGGDERLGMVNYIRLLVVALKDEAYLANRIQQKSETPRRSSDSIAPRFSPDQIEQMRHYGVTHNGSYYECGEMHFDRFDQAIQYAKHQQSRSKA